MIARFAKQSTRSVRQLRCFSSIDSAYTAHGTAVGGRAGGKGEAGDLKVDFAMPKEMGGTGKAGSVNPEQLFSVGYGACFIGALGLVYKDINPKGKGLPKSVKVTVDTGIGQPKNGKGFIVACNINLHHDSIKEDMPDKAMAEKLIKAAHEQCPYSRATKGNIEHNLNVV